MIEKIIKTYSEIHSLVRLVDDNQITFEGSQIQGEFKRAWEIIQEYYNKNHTGTLSFLEVGAWKGLWAIAFSEFCKINKIEGYYTTITMLDNDPNNRGLINTMKYLNTCDWMHPCLIDGDTHSEFAVDVVTENILKYDIVFIDAGHKYEDVINDITKFSPLCNDILLFHDIRPIEPTLNCGVYKAIKDSGIKLDYEIVTREDLMGIGIKLIK
jgi:hypothetical protein